jgi:hypothetical protein
MNIYGRGRFVQSTSHTDSRLRGSNGDSHHAKTGQDFIRTCQDNPSFLDDIVTGDESWLLQYDPVTKRQNM